jgi:hypothetical protein
MRYFPVIDHLRERTMPTQKFKSAAIRFEHLAEQATTPCVRAHLLRLARHYEALLLLPAREDDVPAAATAPRRGEGDGVRGRLQR